jgi:hypothetical protein
MKFFCGYHSGDFQFLPGKYRPAREAARLTDFEIKDVLDFGHLCKTETG